MASFGVWWLEIVVAVVVVMGVAFVGREVAAFISVRRIRRRDGGALIPRTREEYLLIFPDACPRCLSRRRQRVRGWHVDRLGASEFVDTWQCADCAYTWGDRVLSPMRDADIAERSVTARQRWFISRAEAELVRRPDVDPHST